MTFVFDSLDGHEVVSFGSDPASGLRAIIAIHSTTLGPALGGVRFYPYPTEQDALRDVLALSRAMTYKAACAGLDNGGGKAIIMGDPARHKSAELLTSFGRFVDSLGGRYLAGCDVGTTPDDLAIVGAVTPHAHGRSRAVGGCGDSGELTAHGVYIAILACAEHRWGSPDLGGRAVAVQGLGKVGGRVARLAHRDGAKLIIADRDDALAARLGSELDATVVAPEEIHAVAADVFSPNALGGVVNAETLDEIRAAIIAGGANNQLATPDLAARLQRAGVLYAPDFVVNAGGLIQHLDEREPGGYDADRARAKADGIALTLRRVFDLAAHEGLDTVAAAETIARRRLTSEGDPVPFVLPS